MTSPFIEKLASVAWGWLEDHYAGKESPDDIAELVRTVLTAMREPDEGMVLAGLQELPFGPSSPAISKRCFQAMIDKVLEE